MNPPLRERLRWSGQEPTPADASADRAVMARSFVYLYGAGAAMALFTLVLPHSQDWWEPGIAGVGVAAATVALFTIIGFDRLPTWYFHALPALGTLHIAVITYSGGANGFAAYAMYFTWVVLSSFYFLSRRWAMANLVFVVVAYAALIGIKGDVPNQELHYVMLTGTLVVGGLLIGLLRDTVATTLRRLEATTEIALTITGDATLDRVLELIVERGRALISARSLVIMLADGDELRVEAVAGAWQAKLHGVRAPLGASAAALPVDSRSALQVPLIFHGRTYGVLIALDRHGGGGVFTAADERLLRSFAASAATAVANAQSVEEDRMRQRITAGEGERRRWARDLHDSTLQALGGLRVQLASALKDGSPERLESAARESLEHIASEIDNLHNIISDLRPPALDTLGLGPAIESLAERVPVPVSVDVSLPGPGAMDVDVETTVFRVAQEALTNVSKHARATHARLEVVADPSEVRLTVADDGVGFNPDCPHGGFGLKGIRERVALAGGAVEIDSAPGAGTRVAAVLPRGGRELPGRIPAQHALEGPQGAVLGLPDGAGAAA